MLRPARVALWLGAAVLALCACHYLGLYLRETAPESLLARGFSPKFNLDNEQYVPTFFSSLLLLAAAAVLCVIASDRRTTELRAHWWALGGVFALLALDEAIGLHEMLNTPARGLVDLPEWLTFAWVVPATAGVALFGAAYARFLYRLPRRTGGLFVLAGAMYVGGAIGAEIASAAVRGTALYQVVMPLEEALEMSGIVVFLYALLSYHGAHGSPLSVEVTPGSGEAEAAPVEARGSEAGAVRPPAARHRFASPGGAQAALHAQAAHAALSVAVEPERGVS